jgi:MFS family permease
MYQNPVHGRKKDPMTTTTSTSLRTAGRARWAIIAVFAANGMLISSMSVRVPSLKLDLVLSTGLLGLGSAIFGLAAVGAMQVAGRLVARVGSVWVVRVAAPLCVVALVANGFAPSWPVLAATFAFFGAVHGTLDVAMNAHAVAVERTLGRYVMNGCHAAWSIGAVAGSLLGAGAAGLGMDRWLHYLLLAAVVLPALLVTGRFLLPAGTDRLDQGTTPGWRAGWTRRVLALGIVGAIVLTCEGAVISWSGVFLREDVGTSLGIAGLGLVAFSASQTVGRLVGDRLQARFSAGRLVRFGTLLAAAGLALALLSTHPVPAILGFAIMGLGLATPLPVLFSVTGRLGSGQTGDGQTSDGQTGMASGSTAALSLSRFTTLTYAGILLAPPLIGGVADLTNLTWTLGFLVVLLLGVAAVAVAVTRDRTAQPES